MLDAISGGRLASLTGMEPCAAELVYVTFVTTEMTWALLFRCLSVTFDVWDVFFSWLGCTFALP
jgi:hypothetical protein